MNPHLCIVDSIFGDTGLPLAFSINTNKTRPPSSAGNGNIFIKAKLTDIKATKSSILYITLLSR